MKNDEYLRQALSKLAEGKEEDSQYSKKIHETMNDDDFQNALKSLHDKDKKIKFFAIMNLRLLQKLLIS